MPTPIKFSIEQIRSEGTKVCYHGYGVIQYELGIWTVFTHWNKCRTVYETTNPSNRKVFN